MTLVLEADINLKQAGLAHAKGQNDKCDGVHTAQVEIDEPVSLDGLEIALQTLHEAAHPRGALSFRNCREPGCWDALEAIDVEGYS
jgi:hypothetical protein